MYQMSGRAIFHSTGSRKEEMLPWRVPLTDITWSRLAVHIDRLYMSTNHDMNL